MRLATKHETAERPDATSGRPVYRVLGTVLLLLALTVAASQVIDYLLANGIEGLLDLVAVDLTRLTGLTSG